MMDSESNLDILRRSRGWLAAAYETKRNVETIKSTADGRVDDE